MKQLYFEEFFAQLSPDELASVYENTSAPQINELVSKFQGGELSANETLEQLMTQLPSIVLNLSAVMTTHMLHSYHNWVSEKLLAEQSQSETNG